MKKRIGELLLEKKVIQPNQVNLILKHSLDSGLRFGEAALDLGVITQDDLIRVFGKNYSTDFFYLHSEYFPESTKNFFPIDFILKNGVLPLGYKKTFKFFKPAFRMNIGMLDPSDSSGILEIREMAKKGLEPKVFSGVKIFLVLADQFIDVLSKAYGITEKELLQRDPESLHETLQLFLDSPEN